MPRTLILTGGPSHPFEDAAPALAAILSEIGLEAVIETDVERGLAAWRSDAGFDLLTVYALRWRMLAERYASQRPRWGLQLSEAARRGVLAGVATGRPVLGLHTAVICFDDWPEWKEILGAAWSWNRSFHPPYGPAAVQLHQSPHPIVAGLPQFDLIDEVYSDLVMQPDTIPLATASVAEGASWPVLWARHFGAARVVCDLLGHDRAALEHPVHRRILRRAAAWALGRPDAEVSVQ